MPVSKPRRTKNSNRKPNGQRRSRTPVSTTASVAQIRQDLLRMAPWHAYYRAQSHPDLAGVPLLVAADWWPLIGTDGSSEVSLLTWVQATPSATLEDVCDMLIRIEERRLLRWDENTMSAHLNGPRTNLSSGEPFAQN
jgi:hypothetical protein